MGEDGVVIQNLTIRVSAPNATRTTNTLNKLHAVIEKLRTAASASNPLADMGRTMTALSESTAKVEKKLASLDSKMEKFGKDGTKDVRSLVTQLRRLADGMKNIKPEKKLFDGDASAQAINDISDKVEEVTGRTKLFGIEWDKVKAKIKGSAFGKVFQQFGKQFGNAFDRVKERMQGFLRLLTRIALVRTIRRIITVFVEGIKEGVKNLYQFSKISNGAFSKTMDSIATSSLYLKNALGTLAANLITSLEPVIVWLVDKIVDVINLINRSVAVLTGAETWTKAKKFAVEYAEAADDATEANKKFKASLLGIDEINALQDKTDSNGSNKYTQQDYAQMFETVPTGEEVSPFLAQLKITFNDLLVNWEDANPEQKAKKVSLAVFGLLGGIAGIVFTGTLAGGIIGTIAGVGLGMLFNSIVFNNDGKLSKKEFWTMIIAAIGGLLGAVVGFKLTGSLAGAFTGAIGGAVLSMLFAQLAFGKDGKSTSGLFTKEQIVKLIMDVALSLLGAGIGFSITKNKAGALVGSLAGGVLSLLFKKLAFDKDSEGVLTKTEVYKLLGAVVFGMTGGIIGAVEGQAALGATLGAGIGLTVSDLNFTPSDSEEWTESDIVHAIVNAGIIIGATAIGASLGGVPGAVLGLAVGSILTIAVDKLLFKKGEDGETIYDKISNYLKEKIFEIQVWLKLKFPNMPDWLKNALGLPLDEEEKATAVQAVQAAEASLPDKYQDPIIKKLQLEVEPKFTDKDAQSANKGIHTTFNANKTPLSYSVNGGVVTTGKAAAMNKESHTNFDSKKTPLYYPLNGGTISTSKAKTLNKESHANFNEVKTPLKYTQSADPFTAPMAIGVNKNTHTTFNQNKTPLTYSQTTSVSANTAKSWNKSTHKTFNENKTPLVLTKTMNTDTDSLWTKIKNSWKKSKKVLEIEAEATRLSIPEFKTAIGSENGMSTYQKTGQMVVVTKAKGGFVDYGDMFIANERGAELVGKIGNKTAVVNEQQIIAAVSTGVAEATYQTNQEQNALIREQNRLLRQMLAQQGNGVVVQASDVSAALRQTDKRTGGVLTGGVA